MNILKFIILTVLLATANASPISIELSGGSVINGELISWNGNEVQIKAEFGTMTLKREQLSKKSLDRMDLLSGDPQKLAAKVSELEATIESLRRDNAALRQQLAQTQPQQSSASQPAASASGVTSPPSPNSAQNSGLSYSRSSTGKRHNSNCRYFGSGSPCGPNDGVPCKICGG